MDRGHAAARVALLLALLGTGGCGGPAGRHDGASVPRPLPKPVATQEQPQGPTRVAVSLPPPENPAPAIASCRAGDAGQCARAAQLYFDGWGVPRDMARVAFYGGLACRLKATGDINPCRLHDLAYLDHGGYTGFQWSSLRDYKEFVVDRMTDSELSSCIESPSKFDEWGWAAYMGSICHVNGAAVYALDEVQSACLDGHDVAACRGWALKGMAGLAEEDVKRRLAPFCRNNGELCDLAQGDSDEETARFREKACLGHRYNACLDWMRLAEKLNRPFDEISAERLWVQICIHAEDYRRVPLSVGQVGVEQPCSVEEFKLIVTSASKDDQALVRALKHTPEIVRAADCTGPLYDFESCKLFALSAEDPWHAPKLPEELRWEERMQTLARMCDGPAPPGVSASDVSWLCKTSRKEVEKEYKSFLAAHPPKGARP